MAEFLTLSRTAFRRLHGLEPDSEVSAPLSVMWFDLARRNRVVGLWANCFQDAAADSVWHRHARGQVVHSARLTAEAERIYLALRDSVPGLRMIKGPALAAQAWPQPGLRSFVDLDFRCGKDSLSVLTEGLLALGYRATAEDARRKENLWNFGWGVSFCNTEKVIVEFNHRMFPPHYPWPDRLTGFPSELWMPQTLDAAEVEAPSPTLHLLIAGVHAVWHGWDRLAWLVDIAGLLVRHTDIFTEVDNLTRRDLFVRRALHCACHAANRIFGPLPGVPAFDTDYDGLADQALEIFIRKQKDVPIGIQRQIHHRLMSPRESVMYTVRRVVTPGDPDFKRWSLSGRSRLLYWILRPYRCGLEHLMIQTP